MKKSSNKFRHKFKLIRWKFFALTLIIILGITFYLWYSTNFTIPSINLADGLEAEEAAYIQKNTVKKNANPATVPIVKVTVKDGSGQEKTKHVSLNAFTPKNNETTQDQAIQRVKEDVVETGIPDNTVINNQVPSTNTDNQTEIGGSCGGGFKGVSIGSGQWAQTGYALEKDGAKCKENCVDKPRECIQCLNGKYDETEICGEGKAVNYITRPDESLAGGVAKANCYIGSVIYSTGTSIKDKWCYNGLWGTQDDYNQGKNNDCIALNNNSAWNGNACVINTPPPPTLPDPTEEEIAKAATECKKMGRYHIFNSLDCGVAIPIPPKPPLNTQYESSNCDNNVKSNEKCVPVNVKTSDGENHTKYMIVPIDSTAQITIDPTRKYFKFKFGPSSGEADYIAPGAAAPESPNSATPNTDTMLSDAPGIINYDTAGGIAGFVTGLTVSAAPCTIPLVVAGPFGLPSSIGCRWSAAIAGATGGNKLGDYLYNKTQSSSTANSEVTNTQQTNLKQCGNLFKNTCHNDCEGGTYSVVRSIWRYCGSVEEVTYALTNGKESSGWFDVSHAIVPGVKPIDLSTDTIETQPTEFIGEKTGLKFKDPRACTDGVMGDKDEQGYYTCR